MTCIFYSGEAADSGLGLDRKPGLTESGILSDDLNFYLIESFDL